MSKQVDKDSMIEGILWRLKSIYPLMQIWRYLDENYPWITRMVGQQHGSGVQMKYPYTTLAKVGQFPWRHYWVSSRFIRFTAYAMILSAPLFYKIHKSVNSTDNVKMWKEKREHMKHLKFQRPS